MRIPGLGLWVAALTLYPSTALTAQADCFPSSTSNEAQTFALKAVGVSFGPFTGRPFPATGHVSVGLEASYLPSVDDATATPTICRPGKGPENANLLAILVRPRVLIGLPAGFAVDAGWIPPIRIAHIRSNLVGIALMKGIPMGSRGVQATLRGHAVFGTVRAPITCPDEALQDGASECFGGMRSDDRYQPTAYGVDGTLSFGIGGGHIRGYVGGGYTRLEPRFQVNFTNAVGSIDNRRVTVGLNRVAVFGGASWSAPSGIGLVGEIYSTPADAVTGRILFTARLGR